MRYVAPLIGAVELQRKLNHPAKCAFSPNSPPPIMRAPSEGQRGSVLFHPTSHFAKSAVAKNDTVLTHRKDLMRRDKRNLSARQAEGCT